MTIAPGIVHFLLILVGISLVASGPVMCVQAWRGRQRIVQELGDQKVNFPVADRLPPELAQYAGAQVRTGQQARAFSDLIALNVAQATGGRTYSDISHEWLTGGRRDEQLALLRETAFMGQSLRSALLAAYQAWQITALVLGLGALLTGVGVVFVSLAWT